MAMVKLRSAAEQSFLCSFSCNNHVKGQIPHHFMESAHESPRCRPGKLQKEGHSWTRRLFRVRPLMDTLRHACKAIYPRKNLAVDERMVAYKANTGMTQYMKAKPTQVGLQVVCSCGLIKWIYKVAQRCIIVQICCLPFSCVQVSCHCFGYFWILHPRRLDSCVVYLFVCS